ncbi:MAG: MFS transporter [Anaerolineaceae bacterium]|jgi:DHA3 family macrolide efflux protein-like MFS transporter|nr:MFS transporter [Anaerolineaceae bacterium]
MQPSLRSDWKKTFFIIWTGQAFSLLGSELVQFALVWYLTKQTGSASVLAFASFVALIPRVLISPFSGALVDRWNRQRVMIFADAAIAVFTMLLAVIFWLGKIQIWHIYAIMFIRSLGSGFHWPAMQASTSLMVPKEQLPRISGLNQTLRGALGIVAPVAAALLLEFMPMFGILSIDVLTAIIAISPLLFVIIPQPDKSGLTEMTKPAHLWEDVKAGFHYLANWKGMFYLAIAATVLNFLLNPGFTFMPLLVTSYFGKGAIDLSLIESAFSAGMILGGIILSAWGGFNRNIFTILTGLIGMAVGTALTALTPPNIFYLAVVGMAITGFMNPIVNAPIAAIIQTNADPKMQGRIFSMLESLVSAMMPISMLIAAPVAEWIGIRGWLLFGAVGCFTMGIAGFFIPALVHLEDSKEKTSHPLPEG